jgi:heterotetrameric sarcosine oxidase gamma subunit
VSEISFKSPVDVGPLTSPDGSVTVADAASTTKVQVRAGADTAAAAALGVPYGRSQRRPDGALVCGTRPDEWTIYGAAGQTAAISATVPTDGFVTVIDITHGRAMLRISGSNATSALGKICNLDLGDELTPNGAVFSASVGNVGCDLVRDDKGGQPSFLIGCERSFGRFLFIAVADACTEFGLEIPAGWELHGH